MRIKTKRFLGKLILVLVGYLPFYGLFAHDAGWFNATILYFITLIIVAITMLGINWATLGEKE